MGIVPEFKRFNVLWCEKVSGHSNHHIRNNGSSQDLIVLKWF